MTELFKSGYSVEEWFIFDWMENNSLLAIVI